MVHLWPYAIRLANDAINESANMQDVEKHSPLQIFAGTEVNVNCKHWKPFGCPVYVLREELQDHKRILNKWHPRSEVGIYLGRSPMHSRNVALVLNRATGHISAQFHVTFDELLETLDRKMKHEHPWLRLAGFTQLKRKITESKVSKSKEQSAIDQPGEGGVRKKRKRTTAHALPQAIATSRSTPLAAPSRQDVVTSGNQSEIPSHPPAEAF